MMFIKTPRFLAYGVNCNRHNTYLLANQDGSLKRIEQKDAAKTVALLLLNNGQSR